MKIVQVHCRYRETGGEDTVVDNEAELLSEHGHSVARVERENSMSALNAARQLVAYGAGGRTSSEVLDSILKYRPDVVHVHNLWFGIPPKVLFGLREAGVPTVATIHNFRLLCANALFLRDGRPCQECLSEGILPAVKYRCYRNSHVLSAVAAAQHYGPKRKVFWRENLSKVITLSEFSKALMVESGFDDEKVHVKSNFVRRPEEQRTVRAAASRRVLYVGRLAPEKGIRNLVEEWSRARMEPYVLRVIGDGPLRPEIESWASRTSNIEYVGPQEREQVMSELRGARAVVLPSKWYEGQPMAALEAYSNGTPVLGSRLGGLGETIRHADPKWTFNVNDRDEWRRGFELIKSDKMVTDASRRVRKVFAERFSDEVAISNLMEIYSLAIAGKTRRRGY